MGPSAPVAGQLLWRTLHISTDLWRRTRKPLHGLRHVLIATVLSEQPAECVSAGAGWGMGAQHAKDRPVALDCGAASHRY